MIEGVLNQFNRGEIDSAAFARQDVERIRRSAKTISNAFPQSLGALFRRQGIEDIGAMSVSGARLHEFIYSLDETALLEFGDEELKIWLSGDTVLTRSTVTTSVTNGDFASGITSWTNASGSGSVATGSGGKAILTGADTTDAVIWQTLTTETGVENALRVVVEEGPVRLKLGTSGAQSDDIVNTLLQPGTYSLAFTPDANVTITLVNSNTYRTLIDSIEIEASGDVVLPTSVPVESVDELQIQANAGKLFCFWSGTPFVIERRGERSWGVREFRYTGGPFDIINLDEGLTLSASALSGNTTLAASKAHFKDPESVGTLRKLVSSGQDVSASVAAEDNGTDSIRVTGTGDSRRFNYTILGSWSATVTLQRSVDDATWTDVDSWTANRISNYKDSDDGAIYYYRLHVKSGDYTSGTVVLTMSYDGGAIEGICRIVSVNSSTSANVQVLQNFGSTEATKDWYQTQWGDGAGYPNACAFYESRLVVAGNDGTWGSVTDSFESFDRSLSGASASIFKTIGFGPVSSVSWLATASRMGIGVATDIIPLRSSSFGEALTQDNANLRPGPGIGAKDIRPVRLFDSLFFVHMSGRKVYRANYDGATDGFIVQDMMTYHPDCCSAGIVEMAVSSEPEPRKWVVLEDGTMMVRLFDQAEDVSAWSQLSIDGADIKRVATLPAASEDRVFFVVDINGSERLCRLGLMSEKKTRPVDLYKAYSGAQTTLTGLSHLDGEDIEVWDANGKIGDYTVSSGSVTLGESVDDPVAGLPITALYESGRIIRYSEKPSYAERKRIKRASIHMADFWHPGITVGRSTSKLQALPSYSNGAPITTSAFVEELDVPIEAFNGEYSTNSQIVIQMTGPATIYSISYELDDIQASNS